MRWNSCERIVYDAVPTARPPRARILAIGLLFPASFRPEWNLVTKEGVDAQRMNESKALTVACVGGVLLEAPFPARDDSGWLEGLTCEWGGLCHNYGING